MNKITSSTYDEHVLQEGVDFQVKTYYEPQDIPEKRRKDIILKYLKPRAGEKILDIGCGVGTFVFHSAKKGADCFGLDYSKESLKMAKDLTARYAPQGGANFIVAEAVKLPFSCAVFDKITSIDFIEHISLDEKDKLLGEIFRVLKNNGFAVIFTPNKIREDIGEFYWRLRHFLFKDKIPKNELHYGLTSRINFERLLKRHSFVFDFSYHDTTRPFLARLPILRHFLSLNLLWIICKKVK